MAMHIVWHYVGGEHVIYIICSHEKLIIRFIHAILHAQLP
jgi:hypothetical protein